MQAAQAGPLCQDWRAKGDEDAAMESSPGMGGPTIWGGSSVGVREETRINSKS